MKKLLGIICLISFTTLVFAADKPQYAVSNIPEELVKDADYVVRESSIQYKIISPGKSSTSYKIVYTIFKKQASHLGTLVIHYDKIRKVKSIKGTTYNQFGKQQETLKSGKIIDRSYTPDGTFVDDVRLKYAELSVPTYPFTIEYEYEIETSGIVTYPDWSPRFGTKSSIQRAEYSIVAPANLPIRYKELYLDCKVDESVDKGVKTYKWSLENLPVIRESEPYRCGYSSYNPTLLVAPVEFEYEGYKGNMKSWESFGSWINQLNKGRDELPEATIGHLKQLTAGMSDYEKTKKIYKYMQSKTRYVGIQLGIGGLQPIQASFVDKVGYGDCKGLVNYTKAMLKAVGVTSYYTLVNAGRTDPDIVTDFVDNQFNHVILCVPIAEDTVWLECTNQNQSFGFLGTFTANRHALLISDDGGRLVKTQTFCNAMNLQSRYGEVNLDVSGDAYLNLETVYRGYQSDIYNDIKSLSYEEQKKWYYELIDLNGLEIKNFTFEVKDNPNGESNEKLNLIVKRYASISGKRIFFSPNLMSRTEIKLKDLENRLSEIEMRYPYEDADTVKIFLPESFSPEFIPEERHLKYDFGEYFSKVIPGERHITYIRVMKIFGGIYPKERYKELQEFYKEIDKADNQRIILINET